MLEVLLSDAFKECNISGPSTGPEILVFKRFKDNWSKINHQPKPQSAPLIPATDSQKSFIADQLQENHSREDYRELLTLAALLVGLDIGKVTIRKPGAIHRARWMAKAMYSFKIELLFDGNESVITLTPCELKGLKRFNRFVVRVYLESWFTSRSAADAPINDVLLIRRLQDYNDDSLRVVGLKMMQRHSWYLSQELATLALFSELLSADEKAILVQKMKSERGSHLLTSLPNSIVDLDVSRTFFHVTGIEDDFLSVSTEA
jgi:hypothetical protein